MLVDKKSKRRYCHASCGFYMKHGVWNASQDAELQKKMKRSKANHYGNGDYDLACRKIYDKIKESCLANNGVENPSQIPGVQEKINETKIKRYTKDGLGTIDEANKNN